jgi:hypothetical protein
MKILIACEESGTVREAFKKMGHDAWSCDLLPSAIPGQHYQGDIFDILKDWSLIKGKPDQLIGHPPCTYLTNAGVRHLYESVVSRKGKHAAVYGEARWIAMREAAIFFKQLLNIDIPKVAIENPIPHKYAIAEIGRKYDQLIQRGSLGTVKRRLLVYGLRDCPNLFPLILFQEEKHESTGCRRQIIDQKTEVRPIKGLLMQWLHNGEFDGCVEQSKSV